MPIKQGSNIFKLIYQGQSMNVENLKTFQIETKENLDYFYLECNETTADSVSKKKKQNI